MFVVGTCGDVQVRIGMEVPLFVHVMQHFSGSFKMMSVNIISQETTGPVKLNLKCVLFPQNVLSSLSFQMKCNLVYVISNVI